MAIVKRAFWDPSKNTEVFIDDGVSYSNQMTIGETTIEATEDDVLITISGKKKISLSNVLERLEALETIYMEDQLLGKTKDPGTIET